MTGRPSKYTEELATEICSHIIAGTSVRAICELERMPCERTFFYWLAENEDFLQQYTRAKEIQAELRADEMIEIAERPSGEDDATRIQRDKLMIDTRKWTASKLLPKKYGDRIQHANDPDNPLTEDVPTRELAKGLLAYIHSALNTPDKSE